MSNYLLYPIVELRGFIILSVAMLCAMTILTLVLMARKKRGIKDFGWQGMLLGRSRRETLYIVLGLSQVCFVFSAVFFSAAMGIVQLAALAALCVIKGLLGLSPAGFFGEAVYGVLMGAALTVGNLLRDYMRQTGAEIYIGAIWVLLLLFILQYCLYHFIRSLDKMLAQHGKKAARQDGQSGEEPGRRGEKRRKQSGEKPGRRGRKRSAAKTAGRA